jgi:hypothetical protein
MKKLFVLMTCVILTGTVFGQNVKENNLPDALVWFGLDYSHTKLIGTSVDFSDIESIRSKYFRSWNDLIISENRKFNIKKAYNVSTLEYEIDGTVERSMQNDPENMLTLKKQTLSEDVVKEIINDCSTESDIETGVIYIVESLNKIDRKATVLVTFFNIKTKEIVLLKRVTGTPKGYGFRNYWINAIYKVLKKSGFKYKQWMVEKN